MLSQTKKRFKKLKQASRPMFAIWSEYPVTMVAEGSVVTFGFGGLNLRKQEIDICHIMLLPYVDIHNICG